MGSVWRPLCRESSLSASESSEADIESRGSLSDREIRLPRDEGRGSRVEGALDKAASNSVGEDTERPMGCEPQCTGVVGVGRRMLVLLTDLGEPSSPLKRCEPEGVPESE